MGTVHGQEELIDSFLQLRQLSRGVKVDLRISCKLGLFLGMAVEQCLQAAEAGSLLNRILSEEDRANLAALATEILVKAEAEEFYGLVKKLAKQ